MAKYKILIYDGTVYKLTKKQADEIEALQDKVKIQINTYCNTIHIGHREMCDFIEDNFHNYIEVGRADFEINR